MYIRYLLNRGFGTKYPFKFVCVCMLYVNSKGQRLFCSRKLVLNVNTKAFFYIQNKLILRILDMWQFQSYLMKVFYVKLVSQLLLCTIPQLCYLELSNLVTCCLSWPGYIPVNLNTGISRFNCFIKFNTL